MKKELSLFTGAGGGIYGSLLLGWKTVGYVEKNNFCCKVINQRIKDKVFHDAPIWNIDIKEFNNKYAMCYKNMVDIITAGFPCQPFSVAGKNLGEQDERNGWPQTIKAIRIIRPRYALLENVPGLLAHRYFGRILGDLAESGYDAKWCIVSAAEVGAPHIRKRLWIYTYSNSDRPDGGKKPNGGEISEVSRNRLSDLCSNMADTKHARQLTAKVKGSTLQRSNHYTPRKKPAYKPARCNKQYANVERRVREEEKATKETMAYSTKMRLHSVQNKNGVGGKKSKGGKSNNSRSSSQCRGWWDVEPDMGQSVDGLADE